MDNSTPKSLNDLEKELNARLEQVKYEPIGSSEFNRVCQQIAGLRGQIKEVHEALRDL